MTEHEQRESLIALSRQIIHRDHHRIPTAKESADLALAVLHYFERTRLERQRLPQDQQMEQALGRLCQEHDIPSALLTYVFGDGQIQATFCNDPKQIDPLGAAKAFAGLAMDLFAQARVHGLNTIQTEAEAPTREEREVAWQQVLESRPGITKKEKVPS